MSKKARIIIEIDPETSDYKMEVQYCKLDHIYQVCQHICERIKDGSFVEEPEITVISNNPNELN